MPAALSVLETERLLRLIRPGRLLPWLGPALRGLASRRLKADVCRYPPEVQEGERRYCKGCPQLTGCPHGETFEPDPPAGARVLHGQEDAVRPLVIAPAFPAPAAGRPGLAIPVRAVFIGRTAAGHAEAFWTALAEAGRDPSAGLDPDGTTFLVEEPEDGTLAASWRQVVLPLDISPAGESLARVRVELTGPLLLRTGAPDGGRRLRTEPGFGDLLRASLRTLGPLFRLYGEGLPEEAFRPLKELAEGVPTVAARFRMFRQPKW
ncbi:MAG: hypothetical protein JO112_09975, partial [Planctomycetes bacterium]|nr:hypothetical protein [Planctomycetota bacterium]